MTWLVDVIKKMNIWGIYPRRGVNYFMNQPEERGDDCPSGCEDVARLRLQLSNYSLSQLVENDVLKRDDENNVVRKGERFTEVWNESR